MILFPILFWGGSLVRFWYVPVGDDPSNEWWKEGWVGGENVGGTNQATTTSNIKCVWSGHSAQIKKKKEAPPACPFVIFSFLFLPSCCCVCCTRCQPLILWTSKKGEGTDIALRINIANGGRTRGRSHAPTHWPDLWFSPSASFLS